VLPHSGDTVRHTDIFKPMKFIVSPISNLFFYVKSNFKCVKYIALLLLVFIYFCIYVYK